MKKYQLLKIGVITVFLLVIGFVQTSENYGEDRVCKNLGKVTDIDNLLYQFYSNIDSQCLFEMPTQELQKIWAVRILDFTTVAKDKEDSLRGESSKMFSEENGFFIIKINTTDEIPAFRIELTKQYIFENGWGGAMGKGEYPKLLPQPKIVSDFYDPPYEREPIIHGSPGHKPSQTIYQQYTKYYWLNSLNSDQLPALFFETNFFQEPLVIYFYSQARALDFK